MNCKPGDIAIIIGSSIYAGRLVEVLYVAPTVSHDLPNGVPHSAGTDAGTWVLKSLGTPFPGTMGDGMYGCGKDVALRPLPKLSEEINISQTVCA